MHGCTCKQYIFQSYDISTFNAMHFDDNPSTCQGKKNKTKKKGIRVSNFELLWSFSRGIMAMKGLNKLKTLHPLWYEKHMDVAQK